MSAAIVDISATKFTLNGIPYLKNFLSVINGDEVRIVNQYDSGFELLPRTNYADVTVGGTSYGSAAALQEALLPVLFTRNNLGGVQINGNITNVSFNGNILTFTLADSSVVNIDLSSLDQSADLTNHLNDVNPHNIDALLIGLGNVDNTADLDKPISDLVQAALDGKADRSAVMLNINSAGDKSGLYVFGKKAGVNEGELIVGWKVLGSVPNPVDDGDFEEPLGLSQ